MQLQHKFREWKSGESIVSLQLTDKESKKVLKTILRELSKTLPPDTVAVTLKLSGTCYVVEENK